MNHRCDLLIETVRWSGGRYHNAALHMKRMLRSSPALQFPATDGHGWLPPVPHSLRALTLKCRIIYDTEIRKIEFEPYSPKTVRSLQMICDNTIDYHLKYADRSRLESLLAAGRKHADEIIIVKNGLVTDTSYSNLIFMAGDRIYTPAKPLLRGVMTTRLLLDGHIIPADLSPADILPGNRYGITHALPVNAMLPPGTIPPIDTAHILPL
ncbi:MAG: aminotransferase class IV [Muribaculaceae bacterium]|nr:aminotransferase class IV [Muribaculaceae bacterium]